MPSSVVRVGIVQLCSTSDVERNLVACERWIRHAAETGAQLVAIPENFNYIGSLEKKVALAEDLDRPESQPTLGRMMCLARETGVWLLLGGLPTRTPEKHLFHNTAVLLSSSGQIAAAYHKIHLFDINIPAGAVYQESAAVMAGTETVSVPFGQTHIGLSICYDLRFPELYRRLAKAGTEICFAPAAFTMHTGKDHWLPLLRARAIENQLYMVAPAQYGRHTEGRSSYGHSCVVDPWGIVIAQQPDREGALVVDLDLDYLRRIRRELPCLQHRRL